MIGGQEQGEDGPRQQVRAATSVLKATDRVLTFVERLLIAVSGAAIAIIALVITVESVMRYFFHTSYPGTEIYVENYLAPAAAFLALAGAARMRRHIGVTLVVARLPLPARQVILSLGALTIVLTFALVTYEGALRVSDAISNHEIADASVVLPPWVGYVVVPIGCGVLCLRLLLTPIQWLLDPEVPMLLTQSEGAASEVERAGVRARAEL